MKGNTLYVRIAGTDEQGRTREVGPGKFYVRDWGGYHGDPEAWATIRVEGDSRIYRVSLNDLERAAVDPAELTAERNRGRSNFQGSIESRLMEG